MKFFLSTLILIFCLQSWTNADDIRDFQIEGMSVGDSLLNYMSAEEIESKTKNYHYANNDYYQIAIYKNIKTYELVTMHLKNNDKKYIISEIEGVIEIIGKNNQSKKNCENTMKKISDSLLESFDLIKTDDEGKLSWDKTGKSTYKRISFKFQNTNGYPFSVICQYWHESTPFSYVLKTGVSSDEFRDYLTHKAYK